MADDVKAKAEAAPFWRRKTLEAMSEAEWESLCDGCARCCLNKLEDEDTGEIHFTSVACTLLDGDTCRCSDYPNRQEKVPDCVRLMPEEARTLPWLPPTCAYRLVAEGHDLYWWHPLVSGDPDTVHQAGVSVRGRITAWEHDLKELQELEGHLADWPKEAPKEASRSRRRGGVEPHGPPFGQLAGGGSGASTRCPRR